MNSIFSKTLRALAIAVLSVPAALAATIDTTTDDYTRYRFNADFPGFANPGYDNPERRTARRDSNEALLDSRPDLTYFGSNRGDDNIEIWFLQSGGSMRDTSFTGSLDQDSADHNRLLEALSLSMLGLSDSKNNVEVTTKSNIASLDDKSNGIDPNIPAVPVPAAFWLFGTALIGFIGISRRTRV